MKQSRAPRVYEAAAQFVDVALITDGSLFTPGYPLWSAVNIDDLYRRYNGKPDTSGYSFVTKLHRQLAGAPDATVQLMAEAIFVHFLIVDDIGGPAKRSLIHDVLSWLTTPVSVPPDLDAALDIGLAAGGLAFKTLRPFQLHFLVEFVRLWKGLADEDRSQALSDPWRLKEVLWQVPIQGGYAMREALLHLIFPDTFEDIVSREHKAHIAEAFGKHVSDPTDDVDRRLLQIRKHLQSRQKQPFSFYAPEVWPVWNAVATEPKLWDDFLAWGRRFRESAHFDEEERKYKLRAAELVGAVRRAILDGGDWTSALQAAFSTKDNNLTRWQASVPYVEWSVKHRSDAETGLRALWSESEPLSARLRGFIDHLPADLLSGADLLRVMSYLLMGEDPTRFPPLMATVLAKACTLTGYPAPSPGADEARRYIHGFVFLDRVLQEATKRELRLRDKLDAQSLVWAVAQYEAPPEWPQKERDTFLMWRGDLAKTSVPPIGPVEVITTRTLQQLADELFLPEDFLVDTLTLLHERKQIVMYGPPGTGKTFVARKLAEHVAPEAVRRCTVQFHPSYSYEDFVEGYRPALQDGVMTYRLQSGPLRRLAARALQHPGEDHLMIIDEINRGNLPRILGELLYAIEYRGEPVDCMYGNEPLVMPGNLLIIGTMNTADRSIGLIDAALRRRFHFVRMFPGEGPLADLLAHWLDKYRPEMREVAGIVNLLNQRLRERVGPHLQVGHSHFLRPDLSQEVLARIWDSDVMPFLEDQFFGREEELAEFRLERLRQVGDADDKAEGAGGDSLPPHED